MNKLDRQMAIALLLQNRKSINAQKIAEYFEISVRTVYRDVQVLCDAGLPIVSLPGEGYAIMDGYKLPPLMFDREELLAFHLASEMAAKYGDRAISEGARRFRVKVEAVLPPLVRLDFDNIADNILVQTTPPDPVRFERSWLKAAERAVRERFVTKIRSAGKPSYEIDPLILYYHDSEWILIARRTSSGELFDVPFAALDVFELLDRKFDAPLDFTFSRYWSARNSISAKA